MSGKYSRSIRMVCLFMACLCAFALTGCKKESEEKESAKTPDYYSIGLRVTQTMSDMIRNEDYGYLIGTSQDILGVAAKANTNDYDSPTAVYSIRVSDSDKLKKYFFPDESAEARLERLPSSLRDQISNYLTVQRLVNVINAHNGTNLFAFANIYNAMIRDESLTEDESVSYLYVFEKGMPIVVCFGYCAATGIFLLPYDNNLDSLSAVREFFEPFGCEVYRVEP